MSTETQTSRTLVKSPPELWAECSDATSLARHLEGFGEIRITRLEPETAVAWEGERASGTVRLEPSGWGTKVTMTASAGAEVAAEAGPVAPEPAAIAAPKRGFFARLFRRAPLAVPATPEASAPAASDPDTILSAALESLGQAHRRPFARG